MNVIVELPEVRRRMSPLSVEEYHLLGEYNIHGKRVELVRGLVIEKPRKSPRYSSIAVGLAKAALQMVPDGFSVRVSDPLTFRDSEPEPDLAVVRGSKEDYREAHPSTALLVVEIVDGSDGVERQLSSIYGEAAVDEYWIILAHERSVAVHRQPINGVYQETFTAGIDTTLNCAKVPGLAIQLSDLLF